MTHADSGAATHMRAVTISREYGSGGGEIASRLASRLGWQLVDHEIVVSVACELGISVAEAEERDERTQGIVARLLNNMQLFEPVVLAAVPTPPVVSPDSNAYAKALQRVIEASINTGHAIIVGRAGQVLLANQRDVLHVRVVAPLDQRIQYVMSREGLDQEAARGRIQLKDRDRVRYLQSEYHCHPDDAHLYDITVNTHILDLDGIVDLLYVALEQKAARLRTPEDELGPGAGLGRYPGQPGDFRPPEGLTPQ